VCEVAHAIVALPGLFFQEVLRWRAASRWSFQLNETASGHHGALPERRLWPVASATFSFEATVGDQASGLNGPWSSSKTESLTAAAAFITGSGARTFDRSKFRDACFFRHQGALARRSWLRRCRDERCSLFESFRVFSFSATGIRSDRFLSASTRFAGDSLRDCSFLVGRNERRNPIYAFPRGGTSGNSGQGSSLVAG